VFQKILEVLLKDFSKSSAKDAWERHAGRRTMFENHCSTSNTPPVNYDVTSLAIIKLKKHQRLADPLLHSGVATRNNRVECSIKSTVLGKVSLFGQKCSYLGRNSKPELLRPQEKSQLPAPVPQPSLFST